LPTLPTPPTTLPTLPPSNSHVCPDCNMIFKDRHAKYDHKRRGKCSAK
jgi:hypothetical protein